MIVGLFAGYCLLIAVFGAVAHLLSLFEISIVPDPLPIILSFSMFAVGGVAALVTIMHFRYKDDLKNAFKKYLSGSLRILFVVLFGYTVIVFLGVFTAKYTGIEPSSEAQGRAWAISLFSVFWVFFHYTCFLIGLATHRAPKTRI